MHPLVLAGTPEETRTTVLGELVDQFSEHGAVATIDRQSSPGIQDSMLDGEGDTAVQQTHWELSGDGGWVAVGDDRTVATVEDVLDRLAPAHDFAVIEDGADLDLPTVAVGDVDPMGTVLTRIEEPGDLDAAAVIEAVESTEPYVTLESLVAEAKTHEDEVYSGAIATFTGRVRRQEHPDDPPTERLEFEQYDAVAHRQFAEIRSELLERDGVYQVLLHHKTGIVESGEDIVFVVVLAGHRGEAFRTVQDGINRLKAEVPLFKKEITVDEEFWRHERPVQ